MGEVEEIPHTNLQTQPQPNKAKHSLTSLAKPKVPSTVCEAFVRGDWGSGRVEVGGVGGGWVFRGSEFSPGLTPASMGSGWWVNGMRADLVWPDRALKSNFPGFLREPGDESPGKKTGSTEWQKRDRRF